MSPVTTPAPAGAPEPIQRGHFRRRRVWLGKQVKPGDNARKVRTARADAHAAKLAPTIKKLRARGATLRAIAAALNKRNIPTATGRGEWQAPQVARVLAQL